MMKNSSSSRRLRTLAAHLLVVPEATVNRQTTRRAKSGENASMTHTREGKALMTPVDQVNRASFPRGAKARGLPGPVQMSGITFRTNDLPTLSKWWATVLDTQPQHQSERLHVFRIEAEETFTFTLMGFSKEECPDRAKNDIAVDHFAISYATVGDLISTFKRLETAGIKPGMNVNHGMSYSAYYMSPDGTQVELQVDTYDNEIGTQSWFQMDDFAGAMAQPSNLAQDAEDFLAGKKNANEVLTRNAVSEKDIKGAAKMSEMGANFLAKVNQSGHIQNVASPWMTVPVGQSPAPAPITRKVTPQYMAHFVLRTQQPNVSTQFYDGLLGTDLVMETPFIRFLSFDDEHHRVGVMTGGVIGQGNARVPGSVGVHSLKWTYGSMPELVAAAKRLQRRGVLPVKILKDSSGDGVSIFFHDPDMSICELRFGGCVMCQLNAAASYPGGVEVAALEELEKAVASPELAHSLRGFPPAAPA